MTTEPNAPEKATLEAEQIKQPEGAEDINELVDDEDSTDENDITVELAKAQVTIKDYWDQIMRLNAEMENNRKRAQRDIENAHKFAVKNFAEALLPVSDSMEMGLNAAQAENANMDSIKEGITMTLELFQKTLEKNGITSVDPQGEKFDPEQHQAMSMMESDEADPNTVMAVMQKGYLLNERLIRPAMVVVSKAKSS
ncbi:MAG: nucleotide exchange factor GrpE [Gammaproteobacteria bacterium]|jgi:molecular chaperone GrpE|nr:nucleotide exchange factor GrpE [Gammaproteobacteria bacterium]MBT3724379.1 nucleotide exchange factor GrpE [Gammaproteobacteria bacterium]MBT4195298.1 nucleotide exchange factor GrpE [Gammaproteobacteria bacterium]MBT4451421.1 nucleotide exchange factor GrpE [Gammaproteobacteria bacterium]MBT4862320.1 nucleotide exchange factor GrpE [Gammaproteobacteria bacterium]